MKATPDTINHLWPYSGKVRTGIAITLGVLVGFLDQALGPKETGFLVGWDTSAIVFILWTILTVFRLDENNTEALASAESPRRSTIDLVMLLSSLASLGAVGLVLVGSATAKGGQKDLLAAIGVVSVVCSWFLVHTLYALRYARLYYDECNSGGIDFNDSSKPSYLEFAYLAFTVGMTYQVSDTDIKDRRIRRTILHQGLLSYLFGTVIVATTINLVAGLGK